MDWITPSVLALSIGGGDYLSSRAAIQRGGIEKNIMGPQIGAATTAAVVAATDIYFQAEHPKFKWYWCGALVVAGGVLIVHNHRVARGR